MRACGPFTISTAAVSFLVAALAFVQPAAAQVTTSSEFAPLDGDANQGPLPNRLAGQVGVVEALGSTVPTDLTFLDEAGAPVTLSSLVTGERPLVVAFVYHDCPMLCSLILDGVADAVEATDLQVGIDYDVLAVSIDPDDTPERAAAVEARYVQQVGAEAASGLHFWTVGERYEPSVKRLAEAVGFRYAYDVRTGEYAHNAALTFLSPDGKITRYLYGIEYLPRDFHLALVEAGEGTVGTSFDRFLLTCFEYDEDAQSYTATILTATKIGGGLLLLVVGGLLFVLWRREVRRPSDGWEIPVDPAPAP